ncbi:AMP-binding protein, partial [bacterium]|nr:AMP-binding protein [bacterium]
MNKNSDISYSGLSEPSRWLLPEALNEMARRYPERTWVSDHTGASMTFAEVQAHAGRMASFLLSLRLERSDRVGVFMSGGCGFVLAWFGIARAGITSVTINTDLHGEFLRHQLRDSGVRCILVDRALLPRVCELLESLPELTTIVVSGGGDDVFAGSCAVVDFEDYRRHPEISRREMQASDIACVMYTSGTSGPSKGVLMPHAHCALFGIGQIECMQIGPDDRFYICLPLFHANGLFMQLGASLLAGIPAFIRGQFSASSWLGDIAGSGATVTNLIGSTAAFVIAQPPGESDRKHALRAVLASPNMPQHEEQFRKRFAVPHVVSGFGMTEVNIPIWGRTETPAPGAAGWVHEDHFECAILDPETDRRLVPGEIGEIVVRPKVPFGFMAGYLNAPEKTVEAWRNLWFHTGDAGV